MKKKLNVKLLVISLIVVGAFMPWHLDVPLQTASVQPKPPTVDYPSIWRDNPPNTLIDSWGYPNRICASYVAYKVYKTYHISVANWGNSYGWMANALQRGYRVDNTPTPNSIALYLPPKPEAASYPGHVQWVEHINKNGTIHVSQYNGGGQAFGYNEDNLDPNIPRTYIHFN